MTTSLSHGDWSLQRKGPADQARHQEKIKEAIRENLPEIIAEEAIITNDGKRLIKVPIRTLEEYHFRFDPTQGNKVGQGDGDSEVGDVIGRLPKPGKGDKQAGGQPGIDYYEAEISVDELAELIFADLGLPRLKPKAQREVPSDDIVFNDLRKMGPFGNLDKRRTIIENIKRNAKKGEPAFKQITNDDLRFKVWQPTVKKESSAVVIAMRDASGSMGEMKKYLTRSLFFWMVRFLRTKFESVEIVFITHHSQAQEVDEETFFHLGESGGTRVSSAYQLAYDIIERRYHPDSWNIYPFHFSDGDNWSESDNRLCVELVRKMLKFSNLFGYGEIREGGYTSSLMSAFTPIKDPHFVRVVITGKKDVYPALQKWFTKGEEAS